MAKFRKKPVVIDALQWTGENFLDVSDFVRTVAGTDVAHPAGNGDIPILTLEDGQIQSWMAAHVASKNDWIIIGVANEVYPCKPDIFDKTYEPVVE